MSTSSKTSRAVWASLTHDNLGSAPPTGYRLVKGARFFLLNFGLLLGNILVLFNTGAFASVSLHACGELGVSPSHASWMQTYYFIFLALALPVSTWASAYAGPVRLYVGAMLAMMLASALCAMSGDLTWFLAGRALQGFFGGLTIPVSQTLLMSEYSESSRPFAVSLWSIAALSPFTLGPAAGGWIADAWGWRWLFYLNIPLPLLAAALAWALLDRRPAGQGLKRFDTAGFVLLTGALFCLQTVLNQGQDEDWFNSTLIVGLTLAGMLLLIYFTVWELGEDAPLVDLRLLARRNFALGSFTLACSFLLMYGLLSILLVRLQSLAGYTSFLAGSVLLPLALLAKPIASVMHKIVHWAGARVLGSVIMLLFAWYCGWSSTYDFFGRGSWFDQPLASQILEGLCLGGLFVPLTTVFLAGLTPRRQVQAVELGGMLRILGGSAASPLFGVFWERRAAFHQQRLTESFTLQSDRVQDNLASLQAAGFQGQTAIAKLTGTAVQHAGILALNDAFRLAEWIFVGLAVLVWVSNPVRPKPVASAKEELRETTLEDLVEEP